MTRSLTDLRVGGVKLWRLLASLMWDDKDPHFVIIQRQPKYIVIGTIQQSNLAMQNALGFTAKT